jgi:flagellar hook assembly protein FlgD
VKLVNLSNTSPVDLRINREYSYRGTDEITKFKLVVGKKQFVEQELVDLIPQTVELLQNYPNPFNSSTTIIFRMPKERRVQLDILSVLGQKVRTLVDEWLTPGSYSIAWDGTDNTGRSVASGVYFYRLVSEGHPIQTRKLTILK